MPKASWGTPLWRRRLRRAELRQRCCSLKAEHGVTPLHLAAYTGSVELVELLLAKGADPNARADKGATPLVAASRQGHKKVEAVLLRHGAKK
jgi:ankyrin repeat protein